MEQRILNLRIPSTVTTACASTEGKNYRNQGQNSIEIINNKARHNLIDAKCRWHSDRLDGAGNFREPLGQTKVMQIHQRETQIQ